MIQNESRGYRALPTRDPALSVNFAPDSNIPNRMQSKDPTSPNRLQSNELRGVSRCSTRFSTCRKPDRTLFDEIAAWREHGLALLSSSTFHTCAALVIAVNVVCMGLETDINPDADHWEALELTFLSFFTFELLLRLTLHGPRQYFNLHGNPEIKYNLLDFSVVVLGLLDAAIAYLSPSISRSMQCGTLFRIVRLLRILRIFRIINSLRQLYLLAYGFAEAAAAVFWVSVLAMLMLYVCSIFVVRAFGQPSPDDPEHELYDLKFGSIPRAMLTLFELMSQPDLEPFHHAMFKRPALICFLVMFIVFGSFGIIALLTGVISERVFTKNQFLIEEERFERESKRSMLQQHCRDLFDLIDDDGDGQLTLEEITEHKDEIRALFHDNDVGFAAADLDHMFLFMDADGSGSIDKEEFVNGVMQLCDDVHPMTFTELHYMMSRCASKVDRCERHVDSLSKTVDGMVQSRLDDAKVTGEINQNMKKLNRTLSESHVSLGGAISMGDFDKLNIPCTELANREAQAVDAVASMSFVAEGSSCSERSPRAHDSISPWGTSAFRTQDQPSEMDLPTLRRRDEWTGNGETTLRSPMLPQLDGTIATEAPATMTCNYLATAVHEKEGNWLQNSLRSAQVDSEDSSVSILNVDSTQQTVSWETCNCVDIGRRACDLVSHHCHTLIDAQRKVCELSRMSCCGTYPVRPHSNSGANANQVKTATDAAMVAELAHVTEELSRLQYANAVQLEGISKQARQFVGKDFVLNHFPKKEEPATLKRMPSQTSIQSSPRGSACSLQSQYSIGYRRRFSDSACSMQSQYSIGSRRRFWKELAGRV